jgi:hypothetical protein
MNLRLNDNLKNLLDAHPANAPTGRIKSFLFHPERKTLAPSCMLRVYKGDLAAEIQAISWYLQTNAGIKVHLHETCLEGWKPVDVYWKFTCGDNHPDLRKMQATEQEHFLSNAAVEAYQRDYYFDRIIRVEDSMESIRDSWAKFITAALEGQAVLVDLSAIRPAGKSLETKIVSTGIFGLEESDEGFLSVYEWLSDYLLSPCVENLLVLLGGLCKVVARGGTHKNGIVTTSVNSNAPFVWDYLDFPLASIPGGSKKSVRFNETVLEDEQLCERIVKAVNEESVFLEKIVYQSSPEPIKGDGLYFPRILKRELYANVCMGLWLDHSASCLTSPFNIAQCATPEDIPAALCAMTRFLCEVHVQWRALAHNFKPELYLSLEKDKQVGVTCIGLASFLAAQGVTYQEHVEALEWGEESGILGLQPYVEEFKTSHKIAYYLWRAYLEAAKIAREYGLERAFGIEPNQRCYLDYKDLEGYTVSRQIDPPFSNPEARESSVHGQDIVQYHPLIETAEEVGHDLHQRHHEAWQRMMEATGLAHGSSFDLYKLIDVEWFKDFVKRSPLKGTYYQQASKVNQSYLDKGNLCLIEDPECMSCGS